MELLFKFFGQIARTLLYMLGLGFILAYITMDYAYKKDYDIVGAQFIAAIFIFTNVGIIIFLLSKVLMVS